MGPISSPIVGSAGQSGILARPQRKHRNPNAAPQSREVIISPSTPKEGRDRPDAVHEMTHMDLTLQNKIDTDGGKKARRRLRKLFALWTQAQRVARMFKRLAKDGG
ncbi:hypothetical protein EDD18DRAFT_1346629 [Armillaria luteobubalina]|uniref:Uncharacterized protein n=1 Tax=Armillaria luteobubalina TaxID=153913 RepID=A0AA39QHB5_9AGAR|nr:hypothetical protein EDD18DRAFT_1346629 [Armillaria luteobubalina]